jgi:hypothetical protein
MPISLFDCEVQLRQACMSAIIFRTPRAATKKCIEAQNGSMQLASSAYRRPHPVQAETVTVASRKFPRSPGDVP